MRRIAVVSILLLAVAGSAFAATPPKDQMITVLSEDGSFTDAYHSSFMRLSVEQAIQAGLYDLGSWEETADGKPFYTWTSKSAGSGSLVIMTFKCGKYGVSDVCGIEYIMWGGVQYGPQEIVDFTHKFTYRALGTPVALSKLQCRRWGHHVWVSEKSNRLKDAGQGCSTMK